MSDADSVRVIGSTAVTQSAAVVGSVGCIGLRGAVAEVGRRG